MKLTTVRDAEAAAELAAARIVEAIEAGRSERGRAHVAVSGGTTPRRAYELLAERLENWEGVEIWFADERAVPPEHEDSNFRMVEEVLFSRAPVPPEGTHRMAGERDPDEAAARYAEELVAGPEPGPDGVPALDLALLGIGEDGHTASIFPDDPTARDTDALCVAIDDSPKPPPRRITLTLRALAGARSRIVLATGAGKADAVRAVRAGPDPHWPTSLLPPDDTELIVDEAALAPSAGGNGLGT